MGPNELRHAPIDELRPRVDELHDRENLTAIVDLTKRAGIPLVFVLLRDNPLQSGYLNHGIERLAKAEYEAAIGRLQRVGSRQRHAC